MLHCYVYQFNTGDEDDDKRVAMKYSINKRTIEQHSAKCCLSHKSSNERHKEREEEEEKKK
jgi:hypothetical protein